MKKIYILKQKGTGKILFGYRTFQGNVKKAIFNRLEHAQEALDKYITRNDLEVVDIGEELK